MADPMPERVVPMLARLSKLPRDDGGWAYEIKWDGVRAIAYVRHGGLRLESRNLNDITPRYPEVHGLAQALGGASAVFDGEVVAFDEHGRSSFERLQGRMHLTRGVEARAKLVPVVYCIFDLLWIDGENLMSRPYTERRERLEGLGLEGAAWRVPGYSTRNGEELLAASAEQNLEGIVCKRLDSQYEPGRRGGTWLKVKNIRRQELVLGGWTPGEGRRAGRLGALHVGYYDDGALRYAGKVGTGFTEKELDRLEGILRPLGRSTTPFEGEPQPPRGTHHVDPELVAEVEFTEWTSQKMLRHPSYKGLRDDKRPIEVVLEKTEEPVGPANVLFPEAGFTRADAIHYYLRIAPTLLPYLHVADVESVVELAETEPVELRAGRPDAMVFEVDGPAAALQVKALFDQMKLQTFPRTSASGQVQVFVPLNGGRGHDEAASFANAVAETLEAALPGRVRSVAGDAIVAPYSLLAGPRPVVSTPVAWDEVASGALVFDPEAALRRVDERGDLFAPVLTLKQDLPSFD